MNKQIDINNLLEKSNDLKSVVAMKVDLLHGKDISVINELHYLLSSADKNNREFILSKLSNNLINKINHFGTSRNFKNDFAKKKGYEV
jgi:hypothetical protein